MDDSPRHIVALMGIVSDADGRVPLVRGDWRGWEPPGGQVERGEDLLAALQREIAEESSCQVDVGRLVGVYSNVGPLGLVVFIFLCVHYKGEPCAGHECLDAGWFDPQEAQQTVTHPAQAVKLVDALSAAQNTGVINRSYRTTPDLAYKETAEWRC